MQILHRDPIRVLVTSEVEHRRDVRMRDPGGDPGLVKEHLDERFVLDEMRMNLLDGDPLLESAGAVHACKVHAGHTANPDLVDDAVATQEVGPTPTKLGQRSGARCYFACFLRTTTARGRCASRVDVRSMCILRQASSSGS